MTVDYDKIADLVATKVDRRMAKLEEKLKEKDDVIEDLNSIVNALESKIDDLEQYSRRTSIRIHGLKEEEGENMEAKVENVMKSIGGVDSSINRFHRVGKPKPAENKATTATRQVIVQFKDYTSKKQVMKARSKLRE